jgi:uncharacterized protein (TIGR03382 family)
MSFRFIAPVAAFAFVLVSANAGAQTVCPTDNEGQACDGGSCVPASCTFATAGGGMMTSACGLCVSVGPGQCLASDDGKPCEDGGTCLANGGGGGGGAGGSGGHFEAGTLTGFSYGFGTCVVPHDGGVLGDGGDLSAGDASANADEDAGAAGASGGHAVDAGVRSGKDAGVVAKMDAGGAPHAEAGGSAADSGSSSGGCSATGSPTGALWPLGFAALGLALIRRRTRS